MCGVFSKKRKKSKKKASFAVNEVQGTIVFVIMVVPSHQHTVSLNSMLKMYAASKLALKGVSLFSDAESRDHTPSISLNTQQEASPVGMASCGT